MKKISEYDAEAGVATCALEIDNDVFYGIATCAPEDFDMMSEFTGTYIAEKRAEIKYLQHIKNNRVKPVYEELKHIFSLLEMSSKYNPKSHEAKILKRQMKFYKDALVELKIDIATEKQNLNTYINDKEKLYQTLRRNRKKQVIDI